MKHTLTTSFDYAPLDCNFFDACEDAGPLECGAPVTPLACMSVTPLDCRDVGPLDCTSVALLDYKKEALLDCRHFLGVDCRPEVPGLPPGCTDLHGPP